MLVCPRFAQVLRCSRWQDLQDPHLEAFAEACRTLRSLSLVWCTRITDAGLRRVLQANPGLETLDLEGCYNLVRPGLRLSLVRLMFPPWTA